MTQVGKSDSESAKILETTAKTASHWVGHYSKGGMEALVYKEARTLLDGFPSDAALTEESSGETIEAPQMGKHRAVCNLI